MCVLSEGNVEANREALVQFKREGYRFEIDQWGYAVWYKNEYVHGAGVIGREPQHYKHRDANRKMNLYHAVLAACDHKGRGK